MNNQISIFITIINSENSCSERELISDEYIFSDNNIAENILESKDKYKFLLKNFVIDNTIVAFIIKIIKDKNIIYNQLFDFVKVTGEIKTNTSHTIMTYEIKDSFLFFTRFWIYTYKYIENIEVVPEVSVVAPVEIPVEVAVEVPVEIPVEIPVEVAVEVAVEAPVEVTVEIPVEIPVEVAVEVAVEAPVEVTVEVPVEVVVEAPVEVVVEAPVEVAVEAPVEVPVEYQNF